MMNYISKDFRATNLKKCFNWTAKEYIFDVKLIEKPKIYQFKYGVFSQLLKSLCV